MIANFKGRLARFRQLSRRVGLKAALEHALRRLTSATAPAIDIIDFYGMVTHAPFGPDLSADFREHKTINWVIPDFEIGSGGHLNIFRLIYHLERLGYECRIIIVGHCHFASAEAARQCIRKNFVPLAARVWIGIHDLPQAWYTIATSWMTAYYVRAFRGTRHKCYFVQDFEAAFYAAGSEALFAENTYRFGFYGITAGGWLAEKLSREYGMWTRAIGFSVEHERYRPMPRKPGDQRRVFFYARPATPRRAFEMGILVLNEVAKCHPDVHFILAGWDVGAYKIPFPHTNAGVVELDKLPELYSQCDAALVISCTNLSLLPLELMACGCPVVSNRGPNVEWLLNQEIAVLADATVEALSEALITLLENEDYRQTLRQHGIEASRRGSWHDEAVKFAAVLEEIASISKAGD